MYTQNHQHSKVNTDLDKAKIVHLWTTIQRTLFHCFLVSRLYSMINVQLPKKCIQAFFTGDILTYHRKKTGATNNINNDSFLFRFAGEQHTIIEAPGCSGDISVKLNIG